MWFQSGMRVRLLFITFSLIASFSAAQDNLLEQLMPLAQENNAEAQYHVGMIFNNGISVPQNLKRAFEWFEKGANNGDALAAYKLGCYFDGQFKDVVPHNPSLAFGYKLSAAQAGYSLAQQDVAASFFKRKDLGNAIRWTRAAAEQGEPLALYNLSVSYREGQGVLADKVQTYSYFKLAKLTSEGKINPNAQATLDEMKLAMSPDEIERAEQFVSQWKAKPSRLTLRAKAGLSRAQTLLKEM